MNTRQIVRRVFCLGLLGRFCLLGLLGLTLIGSPLSAQVFDSGPSDSALFDDVINVPTDPDIADDASIGGDGLTTQLNVSDGGTIGSVFLANSGSEVNTSMPMPAAK